LLTKRKIKRLKDSKGKREIGIWGNNSLGILLIANITNTKPGPKLNKSFGPALL